jgi:hypothetical protein
MFKTEGTLSQNAISDVIRPYMYPINDIEVLRTVGFPLLFICGNIKLNRWVQR